MQGRRRLLAAAAFVLAGGLSSAVHAEGPRKMTAAERAAYTTEAEKAVLKELRWKDATAGEVGFVVRLLPDGSIAGSPQKTSASNERDFDRAVEKAVIRARRFRAPAGVRPPSEIRIVISAADAAALMRP